MNLEMDKYIKVRIAQSQGARTIEELLKLSDIEIESAEEKAAIEVLLTQACKCNNVSVAEVVELVNNGCDTLEKVMNVTQAGMVCGRCKGVLNSIIENKR